jgi:hypothetical protein
MSMVMASTGCKTSSSGVEEEKTQVQTSPVRPGAESWQRHALLLPADAPVVFWARSDALFGGLSGLRAWLFAEPAMFGPNGEEMIAYAKSEWNKVIAYLGMDPLAAESWQTLGLDTERDVYVGAYPVEDSRGEEFVAAFDEAMRAAFELDEDTDLLTAIDTMALLARGDLPRGLHRSVAAAAGEHAPIVGVRVVVPVADKSALLENVDRLMRGAEYVQVDEGEAAGQSQYYFHDLEGSWPGVLLRAGEDAAIFDIIQKHPGQAPFFGSSDQRQEAVAELRARLETAVESVASGRPAAPKPPGTPAVGVAVDQEGAAHLAKLRGYRTALERAQIAAVGERDTLFLQDVRRSLKSSRNWEIASGKLSGVSYGLFTGDETGGEDEGFFSVSVTLFGARQDAALSVSPAPLSLGVEQRGMGLSLDLLPLSDEHWQSFIGVTNPGDVVDNFTAADYDPGLFALSFPRSLAVLFTNAEKIFEERVTESVEPVLESIEAFRRLEIASAGIDMRGLRVRPRFVGLVLLDEDTSTDERQTLADAVGEALEAQEDMPEVFYHPEASAEVPYLFFSYGLDEAASKSELAKLSKNPESNQQAASTFFARTEPVALLSLVTQFDPDVFEPIDVSILAQRLGALVFSVEPEEVDGVQTIRYEFSLERPPQLD